VSGEGARYRFGPRERGGALAGWRAGQILTVAAGLVVGVVILRAEANPAGVAMAFVVLAACGALATWPLSGRTGEQWLPVVVRWGIRRTGPKGRRSKDALGGLRLLSVGLPGSAGSPGSPGSPDSAGRAGSSGSPGMGVVHDQRGRTLTAGLVVHGQGFALLGPDDQDRRVAGWASVLAGLAREGSQIKRVQWLAATFPDQAHGARHYLTTHAAADPASACVASYEALLSDIDADACTHDVVLAVQIRLTSSVEAAGVVLQRELASLSRLLAEAEVVVDRVLSADDFVRRLLRTYEPATPPAGGVPTAEDPWPMAMEEEWANIRVDGLFHATFWVAEWPRTEVRSDFLAPLLLGSARTALSVVMEPLGPEKAVRKVEASRTADLADAELRRRGGFMSTARHAKESEVLARREAELADGHASFRYAGFLTVAAPSETELVAACEAAQHAASQARLVIRRLYGDQAGAYTCTLPLARGLGGR
jgi:hypothetical protein